MKKLLIILAATFCFASYAMAQEPEILLKEVTGEGYRWELTGNISPAPPYKWTVSAGDWTLIASQTTPEQWWWVGAAIFRYPTIIVEVRFTDANNGYTRVFNRRFYSRYGSGGYEPIGPTDYYIEN